MFSIRQLFARRLARALTPKKKVKANLDVQHLEDRIMPSGPPLQYFYNPFPEADLRASLITLDGNATNNVSTSKDIISTTSIVVSDANTFIYWDHWEDGYDPGLSPSVAPADRKATQASTLIIGDGNPNNNGAATPGKFGIPADDVLVAGNVVSIRNNVSVPNNVRNKAEVFFDGTDLIGTSRTATVSRTLWSASRQTVLADASEVFDTRFYGTAYTAPVGAGTVTTTADNASRRPYELTQFYVIAAEDGTTITVDLDGPGGQASFTKSLARGESYVSPNVVGQYVTAGGTVRGDKPIQTHLVTGDIADVYESRWYTLIPDTKLFSDYTTPVSTRPGTFSVNGSPVTFTVFLHNPNSSSITVTVQDNDPTTPSSIVVPANKTVFYETANSDKNLDIRLNATDRGFATRFFTADGSKFAAVGSMDMLGDGSTNQLVHDWGSTLQPTIGLTPVAVVGLGDGSDPTSTLPRANYSVVWFTPLRDTTVYVDFDGDPSTGTNKVANAAGTMVGFDKSVSLKALQYATVSDSDFDLTGARIFTVDGSLISVAYGQDPFVSIAGNPAIDSGTTVPAFPVPLIKKEITLAIDANNDGKYNVGDTVGFSLNVTNLGLFSLTKAVVEDNLPSTLDYVPGSATLILPDGSVFNIPDDTKGATLYPFDEGGYTATNILPDVNNPTRFTFLAKINPTAAGQNVIVNKASVSYVEFGVPDKAVDTVTSPPLRAAIGDRVYLDANANGKDDGETGIENVNLELIFDKNGNGKIDAGELVLQTAKTNNLGFYQFTDLDGGNYIVRVAANNPPIAGLALTQGTTPFPLAIATGQVIDTVDYGYSPRPNLQVVKNNNVTTVVPGQTLTYSIVVSNISPNTAFNVSLTDAIPANTTFVSATGGVTPVNGVLNFNLGDIAGNGMVTIEVVVQVNATVASGITQISNSATATDGPGLDNTPNNNTGSDTDTLDAAPDLVVVKSDGGVSTTPGGQVTYTITVTNNGNQDAIGVILTDMIPTGTMFGNASNGGTNNNGTVTWAIGNLAAGGGSATVTITLNVNNPFTGNQIINSATAKDDGGNGADPTPGNNTGSDTTPVNNGLLGDFVFLDANGNGIFDAGETALEGVTVQLFDKAGNPAGSTTTNAQGKYEFTSLPMGDYKVVFGNTDKFGNAYVLTAQNQGADDTIDSDADATGSTGFITVTSGQVNTTIDAGLVQPVSIGDRVWYDLDGNGQQASDGTEPGINGVTVTLDYAGVDGKFGTADDMPGFKTAITQGDGNYLFGNLAPGQYRVTTSNLPNGLTTPTFDLDSGTVNPDNTTLVSVASGGKIDTADFGYRGNGTIGDRVWLDVNGDGKQATDGTEPGLAGVPVTLTWAGPDSDLTTTADNQTYTTVTGKDGKYSFDNLPLGTFETKLDLSGTNLRPVSDPDGTPDGQAIVILDMANSKTDIVDFGLKGQAAVGDFVWYDVDGNGKVNNNEPGISGAKVTLTAAGKDGILGNDDDLVLSTVTDGNGKYNFGSVPIFGADDLVRVTIIPPAGYATPTFDSDGGNDNTSQIMLGSTETNILQDFGLRGPLAQAIGDKAFIDVNGNGQQDAGDLPLAGVVVELYDSAGTQLLATAKTNDQGLYSFPGLVESAIFGDYMVRFITPSGFQITPANLGDDATDSDATVTGFTGKISVPAGAANNTVDAGYYQPITIGDTVFYDLNGDGVQATDGTEPGIPNVPVTLTYAGPDGLFGTADDQTINGKTNANGQYIFNDRIPGVYRVSITPPSGFGEATGDFDGNQTPNTATSNGPITSGTNEDRFDFGLRGTGTIGDRVFLDANGNGKYDIGEGLDGVTVTLMGDLNGDGTLETLTAITQQDGLYSFNNLRNPDGGAQYSVTVNPATLPRDAAGNPIVNNVDPDTAGAGDNTASLTLTTANPTNLDQDFGYTGPGLIGDTIFLDVNNNGVADPGEGITGVIVSLSADVDGDGVVETFFTKTNNQGIYSFANLPVQDNNGNPINYTVAVDTSSLPNGVSNTVDPDNAAPLNAATLNLAANPVRNDVDFGYRSTAPGSVGDRVFLDFNGDNQYTPGEGLTGVTVTLTADVNGDGVPETFNTVTDADGFYNFTGLPINDQKGQPIIYTAKVTTGLPAGVVQSFDSDGTLDNTTTFTLVNNPNLDTVDFGYKGTGSLGDRVWIDVNGDGKQGPINLEPGLPGAKVTLTFAGQDGKFGTADDVTTSTITGANGIYGFGNLPQGAYQVSVDRTTVGTNAQQTFDQDDANPVLDDTANINLTNGQQRTDVDFGYVGNGFVGDRVYIDQDGNGKQSVGEPNIPGAVVQLTWTGADGVFGSKDDVVFTTTTTGGTSGPNYGFPGLLVNGPSDQYRVEVLSVPSKGLNLTDSIDDGIVNPTNPVTIEVSSDLASPLNQRNDIDFGYDGAGNQSLAGSVYNDLNNNGLREAGEPGIAGVTIRLVGTDLFGNPAIDPATGKAEFLTTTDADGNYNFTTIVPGVYTLTETQPANYLDGTDAAGNLGGTPQNDLIGGIDVTPGATGINYNFGEIGTSITGTVFNDGNRDGTPNNGEPGLPGVTVTLLDGNGNPVDDPSRPGNQPYVVVTGPDGTYRFDHVPTGQYKIVETQPAGYGNSPVGPTTVREVTLTPTGSANQNFGETLASISGLAYVDANNNGAFDDGEQRLANIPVTLTGTDSNGKAINRTVVTGGDGTYRFDNLFPSTVGYTINEGSAAPYLDGKANAPGSAGGVASGPNSFRGVVINAGTTATDYNFGEIAPAGTFVAGSVFQDKNVDGIRQPNEPGIGGVTVTLLDAGPDGILGTADDGPSLTTTTDANGNYVFPNLTPGRTYQIVETQPGAFGDGPVGPSRVINVPNLPTTGTASLNFPEVLSSVAGTVYFDANLDGRLDANDVGLPNVEITLTGTDVNGVSVSRTTTTDAQGNYLFTDVPAGLYTITEPSQPAGFVDSIDTAGSAGGVAGNDVIRAVSVGGGANITGYNFSERGAPVSGIVFTDVNRDGSIDPIDSGIPSVTLTLVDAQGNVVATTTTNPDGSYSFPNVSPGNYTIVETQPNGFGDSTAPSQPVTVVGTPVTNVNFGDTLSTVSGSVYVDANGNGTRQPGELGLGGVIVTLTGTDANGNPVNLVTTTDANGDYSFTGVLASDPTGYTITQRTQPNGYVDGAEVYGPSGLVLPNSTTTDSIMSLAVPAGGNVPDNTFGELLTIPQGTGAVGGTVYIDRNRDGQLTIGEAPLPGVSVFLDLNNDGQQNGNEPVAVTDANGNYVFNNVTPGTYQVIETQPAGYGSTTPNIVGNVTVVANTLTPSINFGESASSIAGTVFNDGNSNGVQEAGERGLGNVTLTLLDGNGNTVNNPLSGTPYIVNSKADGSYLFTDLPSGRYQVVETQPAGFATTINSVGNAGGTVNGDTFSVTLGNGEIATAYNYGERALPTGVPISGSVFTDSNRDGQRTPGEPGLPGVTVQLLDPNGNVVATTVTGPDGSYSFPNVPPGNYTIREMQPNGFGDPTVGPFAPNLRPISVGTTPIDNQNFADTLGNLSGSVYLDANANGVRDLGEPGLAGVTLILTGTDTAGNPVRQTVTTGADGSYNFVNLPAGNYIITELQPSGFFDGADQLGTVNGAVNGIIGNDVVTGLVLPTGGQGVGYNFGELSPTAPVLGTTFVSGTVYNDGNNDGVRNPGEVGLAGVPIQLVDGNGNVVQTVTTGPDGSYLFINVPPGNYTVVQPNQPTGFGSTTPNALPINVPTSLTPVTNVSFGEAAGSITGSVFVDLDGNGTPSVGEGLGGVIVTLTGTDVNGVSVTRTTTTDADGSYSFVGLPPSNAAGYTITETQPAGFGDGQETVGTLGGTNGTNDVITGIVLPAAGSATNYNFAEVAPATNPGTTSISGSVFLDGNRDGLLTGGELGPGGVTIQLVDGNGNVVQTTMTNPDGSYTFINVVPGSYTVRELQPGAYGSSSANDIPVSVPNVATPRPIVGLNFAETLSSLSGSVYNDFNGNGVRDAGEPGIANVTVTLTGTDVNGNTISRTVTSDANGNYIFNDLPAGSYTVIETQPTGYADGIDSVGSVGGGTGINDRFTSVPLGGGVQAASYNFGERGVNSVSGTYYLDNDLTGTFTPANGDTTIANAPVLLVGTDANGTPITLSTFTDANGNYRFANLPAGTYRIIQNQDALPTTALPADGVYDGAETVGSLGGSLPANNQIEFTLASFDAANPQNGVGYNFGELPPADPFGFVYHDVNGNGVRDASEPGIAGVTIRISGIAFAGTPFERPLTDADVVGGLTRVTDANGFYNFNPVPPGLYSLTQVNQPAGFLDGQEENADPNDPRTTIVGNDQFTNIRLAPAPIRGPFNFGEILPSSIAGNVYVDANGNGVQDPGEVGLPNVNITLTGTDDRGNPVNITIPTDAAGNFRFSGLRPGTYNITETQPIGFSQGATNIGNGGGQIAGTDIIGQIILVPGSNVTGYRFGEVPVVPPTVPPTPGQRPVPAPVPPLPPLPPITSVAPGVDITKRQFLGSTQPLQQTSVATGRLDPNYAALGSVGSDQDPLFLATAEGVNGELVRVFDLTGGQERFRFRPFPGNPGGVRVATGDVNGDGIPDIITAAGPGGSPHVIIYDGNTGAMIRSFLAFEQSFAGGLFIAADDIDGDGIADLAISADVGGGPRVRVLAGGDPNRVIADFMAIDDPNFRGGTRISLGDINGDGRADLLVGAGVGGGPRIAVYDGNGLVDGSLRKMMPDFFAFEQTLRNGVFVSIGDVDGDGFGDLIFGAGPDGAPRVTAFSGQSVIATGSLQPIANFFAGDTNNRGGVRVTAKDLNADGRSEIITGSAVNERPIVRFFNATTGNVIDEFFAEYAEFNGGIFVG